MLIAAVSFLLFESIGTCSAIPEGRTAITILSSVDFFISFGNETFVFILLFSYVIFVLFGNFCHTLRLHYNTFHAVK